MKRIEVKVNGIVQGVGFRPFIHKLVKEYNLFGWVKNSSSGVIMELEGREKDLMGFVDDIENKSPKLAVIEKISVKALEGLEGYKTFKIIKSSEEEERFTLIAPDVCICDDCLRELFDEKNNRYKFPFINCTNCGPRFTIIKDIPYDRDKTTMGDFIMCSECRNEYENIEDRRYHAQPDCCFDCGPELYFLDDEGKRLSGEDPIEITRKYLKAGKIIAIKGLGGFHLACDALKADSAKKLRIRKNRDEKPFAIMCKDIETTKKWCIVNEEEEQSLKSFRRPIVLLKKANNLLEHISLDNDYYGVMLPYTPVHYLILKEELDTLIMTSANISDMPIIYENKEALEKLRGIADGFLMNNRDINVRCDDSLLRVIEGKEYLLRRSRGYVPFPLKVYFKTGNILACGAEQKASFALTRDEYIFLSQHMGDLKNLETLEHYETQIEHFEKIFNIKPDKIVCDMHPDYLSTEYALKMGRKYSIPVFYVQHHHAHMASCMADNNLGGMVIGIIWDGTGYGLDGNTWGGEFLFGGYSEFKRAGTILPIGLPGGDKAIKDIYRIGYSLLYETFGCIPKELKTAFYDETIGQMIKLDINNPHATSIGRLFDGICAICGIKSNVSYEGQGAVILENIAQKTEEHYSYKVLESDEVFTFDWKNMIKEVVYDLKLGVEKGIISAKFMNTLIDMALYITIGIGNKTQTSRVVLSGGVFQNIYLLKGLKSRLEAKGFNVFVHNRVAVNDEGIAVGQALVAAGGGGKRCV